MLSVNRKLSNNVFQGFDAIKLVVFVSMVMYFYKKCEKKNI